LCISWNDYHREVNEKHAKFLISIGKVNSILDDCPYCQLPIADCRHWTEEAKLQLKGGKYL